MSSVNLSLLISKQFVISVFVVFFYVQNTYCENCKTINPCECVFSNGSIIDLSSVGDPYKPKFENLRAEKKSNYSYFYNPCYSFKLGSSGACANGVAVCQKDLTREYYYDCGDTDKVDFVMDKMNNLHVIYNTSTNRSTDVTLVCSEDAENPRLVVVEEDPKMHYVMTLTTKCACPDLCRKSHLSTGSVLVILFMIFVALYLVLGIIHSSLTRGAHGWELIPHYEFWADFPLLVRDGCVFVVNGCRPETAYERI